MNKKLSIKDVINTAKGFGISQGDTLRSLEHYLCDLLDVSPDRLYEMMANGEPGKKPDRFTLRWDSPLSSIGSYLGTGGDVKGSPDNASNKRIAYTDTDGNAAYADPYKPGEIVIKPGTEVRLQMVAGSSHRIDSGVYWYGSARGYDDGGDHGLLSASWTPSGSYTLTKYSDGHHSNNSSCYDWYVKAS